MEVFKGIPVSPGVVIGRALVVDDARERVAFQTVPASAVPREIERLHLAMEAAKADLEVDRGQAERNLGPEPAKIFAFHLGLLQDRTLIEPIQKRIEQERTTAAYAVAEAFRSLAERFRAMDSEVFHQKASDVLDLDRRVLGKLLGGTRDRLAAVDGQVVVVAHDLTPAQVASLDTAKVMGFATDAGGRTSHTAIFAAALGIPVVVGCSDLSGQVSDGDEVIIDGTAGVVVRRPDPETLEQYRRDIVRRAGIKAGLRELARLEPVTRDGTRIGLLANIEFAHEVESALEQGADGVGLFRTEFLYLTSPSEPTEEEHYLAYSFLVRRLEGRPLVIRTADLGADKYTQARAEHPERNPFLGLRSIRYCLRNLPMFKTQLRAILRASTLGPLKMMFPLISTALELRQAKMVVRDVMEELEDEGIAFDPKIPIGIMIEVPSAALMASVLAREVSFFSIGTNDLIQYTLAVDRGNERVASLYTAANPAVVQLIKSVIRAGKRFNVETSLCGEIAGETTFTMLLIGLGLRTLSLVPSQVPHVKRVIRSVDIQTCERLARKVGSLDSDRQVLSCLRDELRRVLPEAESSWSAA
jgi:phosphotransferase system enzyme I (PtsI)